MGAGRGCRTVVTLVAASALSVAFAGCTLKDSEHRATDPPTPTATAPPRNAAQQWADELGASYDLAGEIVAVAWGDTLPAAADGIRSGGVERDEAFPVSAFEVACFGGADARFTYEISWSDATTTTGEQTIACTAEPVSVAVPLPAGTPAGDARSLEFDVIRDPVTAWVVVVRGSARVPASDA
jgi:hypothetical protein